MSKIVDRISKLLALAEGSEGNEAETAAKMARKLMVAHGIEQGDVDDWKGRAVDEIVEARFGIVGLELSGKWEDLRFSGVRTAWWKRELFFALVRYLDMRCSYRKGTNVVSLYAFKSDVEVLEYLYAICAAQIDRAAKAYMQKERERTAHTWMARPGKTVGTEFRESAVRGLGSKLYWLKREAAAEWEAEGDTRSTALVQTKRNAIREWVDATQDLKAGRARRGADHNQAGWKAGKAVRLNKGMGAKRSRSLEG